MAVKPQQAAEALDKAANQPRSGTVRIAIKAGQNIPELFPYQAERERLLGLASTYDVKNIPLIAPALKHADSTVRDAARQALIQMGDAAAIPFLEEAVRSTRDATEVEALRQIIEFLSLPRFMDVVTMGANPPAPTP
jgi:HEAT repeat protein